MSIPPVSFHTHSLSDSKLQTSTISSRKRKRTEKTVRFDVEHIVIIDTYSPLEYDRGSIFSSPVQYKINPNLLANIPKRPSLSLEIPSSPCDSEASSPDLEQQPLTLPVSNKKKRPKLTVNTSVCSGEGPLFFTKLSTNHVKHDNCDDSDNSLFSDYLIPVTTPTTPL